MQFLNIIRLVSLEYYVSRLLVYEETFSLNEIIYGGKLYHTSSKIQ
jgi:hypothetical protein